MVAMGSMTGTATGRGRAACWPTSVGDARPRRPGPVVLGLPRGGVPVAAAVAARLGGQLDVLTVRKIGAPHHVELAIGAVASGGLVVRNDDVIAQLGLRAGGRRPAHAGRTRRAGRAGAPLPRRPPDAGARRSRPSSSSTTAWRPGATMRAAVRAVRTAGPARVVVAVPVGPPDTCAELRPPRRRLVCPLQPADFSAVGQWYRDFTATTDDDVLRLLGAS